MMPLEKSKIQGSYFLYSPDVVGVTLPMVSLITLVDANHLTPPAIASN